METYTLKYRRAVAALLDSIDPLTSLGTCLEKLREDVQKAKSTLSQREFWYFCRELSEQLVQSRALHAIVQAFRKKEIFSYMPTLSLLVSTESFNPAIFTPIALTPEEKPVIQKLVSGQHFSDLSEKLATSATMACAIELYPLDTLIWIAEHKKSWLTAKFVQRLAVKTALGMNPSDIEQFHLDKIASHCPESMRGFFKSLVLLVARKNKVNFLHQYEKFLSLPLGTFASECRRMENLAKYLGC